MYNDGYARPLRDIGLFPISVGQGISRQVLSVIRPWTQPIKRDQCERPATVETVAREVQSLPGPAVKQQGSADGRHQAAQNQRPPLILLGEERREERDQTPAEGQREQKDRGKLYCDGSRDAPTPGPCLTLSNRL